MSRSFSKRYLIFQSMLLLCLLNPSASIAHVDTDDIIPDKTEVKTQYVNPQNVRTLPVNRQNVGVKTLPNPQHVGVDVPQYNQVYGTVKPLPEGLAATTKKLDGVTIDPAVAARMKVQAKLLPSPKVSGR